MNPLYTTVDWRARGRMLVEYGVIYLLRAHSSFFDGGGNVEVLRDIRRLGEGMILGIHGRKGGGTESP